ncbi:MAG: alpha/beta hydrolase [Pseudomonadota bacterium]
MAIRFLFVLLISYATIACFAILWSDRVIFQPPPSSYKDESGIVKLRTQSGALISAFYLSNPDAEYTILYSHGNAEDIGDIRTYMGDFVAHGFSVFVYDYQGYGTSEGKPSEKRTYEDIEAAYEYMTSELKIYPQNIIVMGWSLGNGPAIYLASTKEVAAAILMSPFVTAYKVVTRIALFPFDKFKNISRIDLVRCPLLIVHGTNDEVIPCWHGQMLFEKAKSSKLSLWVEGGGHYDILDKAGALYWDALEKLLRSHRL